MVMVPNERTDKATGSVFLGEARLILRHWRSFTLFATLGALGGWVASLLMTPYFRAEAVLFPSVTTSVSKALLADQRTSGDDMLALGGEHDLEHLMQLLRSATIRERAVIEFDLMNAYAIKADDRYPQSTLNSIYEDRVFFEKTRFNSIKVEVEDADRDRAIALANFICNEVDSVWRSMRAARVSNAIAIIDEQIARTDAIIRPLQDSLSRLHHMGIHDYRSQAERYNEYIGAAIVKNDNRAVAALEGRFERMADAGPAYLVVQDALVKQGWRKNELLARREVLYAELNSRLPHMFILDKAAASDKPVRPVRWFLLLIGAVSGMFVSLGTILLRSAVNLAINAHGN